jgi:signal peptidase I
MPLSAKLGDSLPCIVNIITLVFGWKILKVKGNSMFPYLFDGDYVLGKAIRRGEKLFPGECIELLHPDYGSIIKTVSSVQNGKIKVTGRSKLSSETDQIGQLPIHCAVTRIIWRISFSGIKRLY